MPTRPRTKARWDLERYGLVRLEKGEGRKLRPVVTFGRVELTLKVAA